MRKFAFLLFLVLFGIFTSLLNPTKVAATNCCNPGYTYCSNYGKCLPGLQSSCTANLAVGILVPGIGVLTDATFKQLSQDAACGPMEQCNNAPFSQTCGPKEKNPDVCPRGKTLVTPLAIASLTGNKCCDTGMGPIWSCIDPIACSSDGKISYKLSGGKCVADAFTPVFLCLDANGKGGKCDTALGPIDTKPEAFVAVILKYALVLGGLAIIFTLIMIGYTVLTSQGNPEKLQAAKEMALSLFTGFLFLVFSFTLLRIIGVDILGLPGIGP